MDGRETNRALSEVIRFKSQPNDELETQLPGVCSKLGIDVRAAGNFGITRKFWDLS